MSSPPPQPDTHPGEVRRVHRRLLDKAGLVSSSVRTADGAAVHVVERGSGPPAVFIHGSGSPGLLWLPLLDEIDGVRAIVVDRPGFGLSEPARVVGTREDTAVAWIDQMLDALELESAILIGHSMGGLWSLFFVLARPERVDGLAMIGTPSLPGTRAPLPFRLLGTPGIRTLIGRQRETPTSVHRFATMIGEGDTIGIRPDLVDLMVAVGNDPIAGRALEQDVRPLISPWALLTPTGFRRAARVAQADLARIVVPTLLIWGDHDPVGGGDVARQVQALIPRSELAVVEAGHVPWLGEPDAVAAALNEWARSLDGRERPTPGSA